MVRVPEVLDCWFESGSMPFAQLHYPFERTVGVRGDVPGRLHRRIRGADTRVVLHAARTGGGAVRHARVQQRRVPRRAARRGRPQDVEAAEELPGSDGCRGAARLGRACASRCSRRRSSAGSTSASTRTPFGTPRGVSSFRSGMRSTTSRPTRRSTRSSRAAGWRRCRRSIGTSSTRPNSVRLSVEDAMERYDFGAAYDAIETFIETLSGWYLRLSRSKAWSSEPSAAKSLVLRSPPPLARDDGARGRAVHAVRRRRVVSVARLARIGASGRLALRASRMDATKRSPARWARCGRSCASRGASANVCASSIGTRCRRCTSAASIRRCWPHTPTCSRQEVNVKHVDVLSEPDRYVTRTVRLNTPELGKRLKQRLPALQRAVAAGDYVINPDGTLHADGVLV